MAATEPLLSERFRDATMKTLADSYKKGYAINKLAVAGQPPAITIMVDRLMTSLLSLNTAVANSTVDARKKLAVSITDLMSNANFGNCYIRTSIIKFAIKLDESPLKDETDLRTLIGDCVNQFRPIIQLIIRSICYLHPCDAAVSLGAVMERDQLYDFRENSVWIRRNIVDVHSQPRVDLTFKVLPYFLAYLKLFSSSEILVKDTEYCLDVIFANVCKDTEAAVRMLADIVLLRGFQWFTKARIQDMFVALAIQRASLGREQYQFVAFFGEIIVNVLELLKLDGIDDSSLRDFASAVFRALCELLYSLDFMLNGKHTSTDYSTSYEFESIDRQIGKFVHKLHATNFALLPNLTTHAFKHQCYSAFTALCECGYDIVHDEIVPLLRRACVPPVPYCIMKRLTDCMLNSRPKTNSLLVTHDIVFSKGSERRDRNVLALASEFMHSNSGSSRAQRDQYIDNVREQLERIDFPTIVRAEPMPKSYVEKLKELKFIFSAETQLAEVNKRLATVPGTKRASREFHILYDQLLQQTQK